MFGLDKIANIPNNIAMAVAGIAIIIGLIIAGLFKISAMIDDAADKRERSVRHELANKQLVGDLNQSKIDKAYLEATRDIADDIVAGKILQDNKTDKQFNTIVEKMYSDLEHDFNRTIEVPPVNLSEEYITIDDTPDAYVVTNPDNVTMGSDAAIKNVLTQRQAGIIYDAVYSAYVIAVESQGEYR